MIKATSTPESLVKAPSAFVVSGAVVLLFAGALLFGVVMAGGEIWEINPSSAFPTIWNNLGGLYFGILLPILIASIVAALMQPEYQRKNIRWINSQPGGSSYVLREKIQLLVLTCGFIAIMQTLIVIAYGVFSGHSAADGFVQAILSALISGVGMFAVGSFYLWVSTFTRSVASTVSIAIGLTVASMAITVVADLMFRSTLVESILPTTQIISTSFARNLEAEKMIQSGVLISIVAIAWAGVFLALSKRRLSRDILK